MANIKFIYRGKSKTGKLTIRLYHTKEIDINTASNIESKREYWYIMTTKNGIKGERHRKLHELSNLDSTVKRHKKILEEFEAKVLEQFEIDFNNGVPITGKWLKDTINNLSPILYKKEDIAAKQKELEARDNEIKEDQKRRRDFNKVTFAVEQITKNRYSDNRHERSKFNTLKSLIEEFQGSRVLRTVDVNQSFADKFTVWCREYKSYKTSTIINFLKRIRRAVVYLYENDEEGIVEVSKKLKTFTYPEHKNKFKNKIVITLDYEELARIENVDLPDDLENARKVILLGCETGLRFSDYNQLNQSNLKEEDLYSYWEFYTQKTDSYVRVPKSNRIDHLISKFGLPKVDYSESDNVQLNREIKIVCKLAGINEVVRGQKSMLIQIDGEEDSVRRGVDGEYPKYELIGTHTMRRSFATNYYNKLPSEWIRAITGHSSDAQLMEYLNTSKTNDIGAVTEKLNQINDKRNNNVSHLRVV